jgi:hypothetical protein
MAEFENGRPVQVAQADQSAGQPGPAAIPANAQPTQGFVVPGQPQASPSSLPSGISQRAIKLIGAISNPNTPENQKEAMKPLLAAELDQSKLPDQVKQYTFAKAQGYQGSYMDFRKELAAAGKTEVTNNVDLKGETAEAKAAGEAAGKRRGEMFAAAGSAGKTLTNLNRMEGLLNRVSRQTSASATKHLCMGEGIWPQ